MTCCLMERRTTNDTEIHHPVFHQKEHGRTSQEVGGVGVYSRQMLCSGLSNAKDRVKELDKFQKATAEELIEHFKN